MAFSFFKKDSKGAEPAAKAGSRSSPKPLARPLAGPVNRNPSSTMARGAQGPATSNTMADKDLHRTLALETAAKIDAIESEMARDFLRPGGATAMFSNSAANSTLQRASQQPDAVAVADAKEDKPHDVLDVISEDWVGNVNAIELQAEGGGSAIEETAILFANGLIEPAEAGLRAAIQSDQLGESAQRGWLMLFELLQQRGDKAGFDSLTIEYVLRFESSPPAWIDYKDDVDSSPALVGGAVAGQTAPVIVLPETVNEGVVQHLEQLKNHSLSHQSITLDSSNVRSVDPVGAELLLRVINAFKRASHELLLQGADQLVTPLRAAVEPGRRDPSDSVWMLLLEVFRLLNRQHDFEETGIQYCITYEVSPPSWEPAPPNLKTRAAVPQEVVPEMVDGLCWKGTLRGEGEPYFGRLMAASRVEKKLVVDCMYLKRVEFSTATGMLAMVTKVRQNGATIEFRNINYLIGALFALLGVDAVAQIQLRRV